MAFGQVTGARAIYALKLVQGFVSSKFPRTWFSERLSSLDPKDFDQTINDLDTAATKAHSTDLDHEHTELFALRRDQRYATRSRRFLMLRGQQSKIDSAYETWRMFIAQNENVDDARFFNDDIKELMDKPFVDLMKPKA